ncbi:MAG: hypothetical protein M5U26_15570 [Planctomycetota bacterium]|nr:hypothetical protein [Planctomycetota bacterium]
MFLGRQSGGGDPRRLFNPRLALGLACLLLAAATGCRRAPDAASAVPVEAPAPGAQPQPAAEPRVELELDSKTVAPDGKLSGLLGGAWPGRRLSLLWVDGAGRVLSSLEVHEQPNEGKRLRFTLQVGRGIGQKHRIVAALAPEHGKDAAAPNWVAAARAEFSLLPEGSGWDRFAVLVPAAKALEDDALVQAVRDLPADGFCADGGRAPGRLPEAFASAPLNLPEVLAAKDHPLHAYAPKAWNDLVARFLADRVLPERQPALLDEALLARTGERVATGVGLAAAWAPGGYALGQELSLGHGGRPLDFQLTPDLRALFAAWLAREYGSIEALNRAWGSAYSDFAEVQAVTTDEAKSAAQPLYAERLKRLAEGDAEKALPRAQDRPYFALKLGELRAPGHENFAAWCDRRAFDDFVFARWLAECRKMLKARAPDAAAGLSGLAAPGPWGGFDYARLAPQLDWGLAEEGGLPAALLRSLRPEARVFEPLDAARPGAREALWDAWLNGASGVVLRNPEKLFAGKPPKPGDAALGLLDDLRALASGLGLLANAWTPRRDAVALYYSPRSLAVHWMLDTVLDGSEWPLRGTPKAPDRNSGLLALQGWWRVLRDAGYEPHFATPDDLRGERLAAKVLILPKTLCLGDDEIAALERFAKLGGIVIADAQCGVFDGRGARRPLQPRDGPPNDLDKLFGLRRTDYWSYELDGGFVGDEAAARVRMIDPVSRKPAGPQSDELRAVEPGVRATSAWSFGETPGGAAAVLSKSAGIGRFVYLNLSVLDYAARRDAVPAGGKALRGLVAELLAEALDRDARLAPADGEAIVVSRSWLDGDALTVALRPHGLPDGARELARWNAPSRRHWYDARRGAYLGLGAAAEAELVPDRVTVLAALPYRVRALEARARRIDPRGAFRVSLALDTARDGAEGKDEPARHVLQMELFDPQGNRLPHYAGPMAMEKGRLEREIRLGLNEPPGVYKAVFTDVLTGLRASVQLPKQSAEFGELFAVRAASLKWRLEQDPARGDVALRDGERLVWKQSLRLVPEGLGLTGAPRVEAAAPRPWDVQVHELLGPERVQVDAPRPEPLPVTLELSAPLKELRPEPAGALTLKLNGLAPERAFALPLPVAVLPGRGEAGVRLDGLLDEKTWQAGAAQAESFVRADGCAALAETSVRLRHTPTHLLLGVACRGPGLGGSRAMPAVAGERDDAKLAGGDWFEVAVAMQGMDSARRYRLDPAGHLWDALGHDVLWDGKARVRAAEARDGWTAEIAIPWADLDLRDAPHGELLRLGFARRCRMEDAPAEESFWRLDPAADSGSVPALGVAVLQVE